MKAINPLSFIALMDFFLGQSDLKAVCKNIRYLLQLI